MQDQLYLALLCFYKLRSALYLDSKELDKRLAKKGFSWDMKNETTKIGKIIT